MEGYSKSKRTSCDKIQQKSPPLSFGECLQQSKRGDRLNQKCLFCSNGPKVSKAAAAFKSAANISANTLTAWTLLTRLSGRGQTLHEGHHRPAQHPEVDRSCTVWLKGLVSDSSCLSSEMADLPREKPVRPTVIVENVMRGLMWPLSRLVLQAFKPRLLKVTSRARRKRHDEQSQEEDINDASICGSLRSPEVGDSCVNHAAQIAQKE